MTDDLKERLWEVFANVEARPKRRQGVTGMTIDAQMRGTMCQINEYELDVLRDAISDLEARLAAAEALALEYEHRHQRALSLLHEAEAGEDALAAGLRALWFHDAPHSALAAYDARRKM